MLQRPFETKAEAQDVEVKFLESWSDDFEYKAEGDETGLIKGYASIFGEEDRVNDIVLPGAFTKTLKDRKLGRLPMLVGHVQRIPVGVWTKMTEDRKGLYVEGKIDIQSPDGGQLHRVLKMGAEIGISIGYRAIVHEYQTDKKTNDQKRLLKEVDLYECSLVTIPCCEGARVTGVKAAPGESPEAIVVKAAIHELQRQNQTFIASLAASRAIGALSFK